MEMIAIRHGETDYNKQRRVMGNRINAPLNDFGMTEAHKLIPDVAQYPVNTIYSSPLIRARQTAEIINLAFDLPIEFRDELVERDVGPELSGKVYNEVYAAIPGDQHNYDFREFGGESTDDVRVRVQKFLDEIQSKHQPNEFILVVTHAEIIRLLYQLFDQAKQQDVHNLCVHAFDKDGANHIDHHDVSE